MEREVLDQLRRRNWLAIAIATIVMMFSYFAYAAAFVDVDGESTIDVALVGVSLVVAPFVFVVVAFVSRHPLAPRMVLRAMLLLPVVGLGVGLLAPVLGATAGFGVGGALTLNPPDVPDLVRWRVGAVVISVIYTLSLLIVAIPAGVFTGAVIPLLAVGLSDEFAIWRAANRDA